MQSTLFKPHVAIIMDGNGRWAERRGLPRTSGHRAGVDSLRRIIEGAEKHGIGTLTVFAFSSDNWRRPPAEVEALMGLLKLYLTREQRRLVDSGTRLTVIGRRDRLPDSLGEGIARAEQATASGERLHLRVAIDYSARDAILAAATASIECPTRETFARRLAADGAPDVDLLIRTGGEKRLSDFLLWECAYAELHFSDCLWPDFDIAGLESALADFRARDRRFGALPTRSPVAA